MMRNAKVGRQKAILVALVLMAGSFVISLPTYAITPSQLQFYAQNNILFYEPEGGASDCTPSVLAGSGTGGGSSAAHGLSGLQVAWVEKWYSTAQRLSVAYGIPWEAVMAQSILESSTSEGPGTSRFARERNNFFGIGAYDSNPDNAFYYDSPEDGWEGYYRNIQRTATYRNHGIFQGNTITDPAAYIVAAKASGYATDPNYVSKTSSIIMSIQELSSERGWASSADLAEQNPAMLASAAANAEGATLVSSEDGSVFANCVNGGDGNISFVMTDGYVYPMAGATQKNQSSGAISGLSRLPCSGVGTPNSCHGLRTQHNHWALDLGVVQSGRAASGDYDAATNGAVLAIADGKWYAYKDGYDGLSGCASATYQVIKDGQPTDMYWLGHMYYEDQYVAGQTFKAGDVIGHVGNSRCTGNGSTAHLHIDRSYSATSYTPKANPARNIGFYELFNKLYAELPKE